MTDLYTLTRRPVLLPPVERKPVQPPRMSWAEMARMEGHRPGVPPSPGEAIRAAPGPKPPRPVVTPPPSPSAMRILALLAAKGPLLAGEIGQHLRDLTADQIGRAMVTSRNRGRVVSSPAPGRARNVYVYRITPSGRAALEGRG